jgi:molybdopterin-guanine dinucleotide biosynthesis protein A
MACYAFGVDAVAVRTGRFYQPLHAFYRRSCLPVIEESLRQGMTSVQDLFRNVRVRALDAEDLRLQDPELLSFQDIDTPEDYARAQQVLLRRQAQGRAGKCVSPLLPS